MGRIYNIRKSGKCLIFYNIISDDSKIQLIAQQNNFGGLD